MSTGFVPASAPGALNPSHVYTAAGNYTVTLTVRDDDGGSASVTHGVDVRAVLLRTHDRPQGR